MFLWNTLNAVASNGRARGQAAREQYKYGCRSCSSAHHFPQHQQHPQPQETLQASHSYFSTSYSTTIMQFSSIRNFALVVLAGSALALPATTQDTGSPAKAGVSRSAVFAGNSLSMEKLRNEQAQPKTGDAVSIIAITLGKVIGSQLFAGAMKAGIEALEHKISPEEADKWLGFDEVS